MAGSGWIESLLWVRAVCESDGRRRRKGRRCRKIVEMSHRQKLERAWVHFAALQELIGTVLDQQPFTQVTQEYAGPDNQILVEVRWRQRIEMPVENLSLLLGDGLSCMRTALDHLAFALATAHSGAPAAEAGKVAFPIFVQSESYADLGRRQIRLMAPAVQDLISGIQPYHRGEAANDDPLAVLHQLRNIDSHRHLLLTGVVSARQTFTLAPESYGVQLLAQQSAIHYGPFDDETNVARLLFRIDGPNHRAKLRPTVHVDIAFAETGPAAGKIVLMEMERAFNKIQNEIFPLFDAYL